jgi:hypothetical protein
MAVCRVAQQPSKCTRALFDLTTMCTRALLLPSTTTEPTMRLPSAPPEPGLHQPPSLEPGWLLVIIGAVVVALAERFM